MLFALSSSFVTLPEIAKDYPYDLVRDFVSIGFVCEQPMAVAVPATLGINTLGELIDYVKKRPGADQRRGAEPRRHPASHLGVDQAGGRPGMDLDQLSRHAGKGCPTLIGGRVQVIMDGLPSLAGAVNGGQLKLLAVGSRQAAAEPARIRRPSPRRCRRSRARSASSRVMGPPGTPEPIAKKVSEDLRAVLTKPVMVKRFEDIASYINPMSPTELRDYIRDRAGVVEAGDREDRDVPGRAEVMRVTRLAMHQRLGEANAAILRDARLRRAPQDRFAGCSG